MCELNRRPTFLGLPLFPSKTYCAQAWKEVVPVVIWRWVLHQLVESVGCFTRAELAFLMLAHRRSLESTGLLKCNSEKSTPKLIGDAEPRTFCRPSGTCYFLLRLPRTYVLGYVMPPLRGCAALPRSGCDDMTAAGSFSVAGQSRRCGFKSRRVHSSVCGEEVSLGREHRDNLPKQC